jgi:hypothetical protein
MNHKRMVAIGLLVAVMALAAVGLGAGYVWATSQATASVPSVMSYQGYLSDATGQPISGTVGLNFRIYDADTGGTLLWEETHSTVLLSAGYFAVALGSSGSPLTPGLFSGQPRYLQVTVDSNEPLPRQRLGAVPYAFAAAQALTATTALSVPWANLTGRPTGLDDGDDDTLAALACAPTQIARWDGGTWVCSSDERGGQYANVITVAQSGGDYDSVAAALASIVDASATNPYLVTVAPGVYDEGDLVLVKSYVRLRGAGPGITQIRSTRTAAAAGPAAATLEVANHGQVSDLLVRNEGNSGFALAIYSAEPAGRTTLIENVVAQANGTGGVAHFALALNDAEPTVRRSSFQASGATGGGAVNAALTVVNIAGGFPQPLIEASQFVGAGAGSGYGFALTNAAPDVRHSTITGDHRAILATVNGLTEIQHSQLQENGFGGAFLIESTAAASVAIANSGVFYASKHTGTGGLTCIHSFKANYTAASDGTTPATACN